MLIKKCENNCQQAFKLTVDKFHEVQKYKSNDNLTEELQNPDRRNGLWVALNPFACYYVMGKVPNRTKEALDIKNEANTTRIKSMQKGRRLSNDELRELFVIPEDIHIKTAYKKPKIIQTATGHRVDSAKSSKLSR